MTIKGSEIVNKLIGSGLLLASVAFFSENGPLAAHLIPGLLFAAGGFLMVLRRGRVGLDLEAQQRLDRLTEGLTATQQELGAVQERLDRLGEERDFMRQLGSPPARELVPGAGSPVGRTSSS